MRCSQGLRGTLFIYMCIYVYYISLFNTSLPFHSQGVTSAWQLFTFISSPSTLSPPAAPFWFPCCQNEGRLYDLCVTKSQGMSLFLSLSYFLPFPLSNIADHASF